ncbi:hypothetical protein F5Y15DRAFT_113251 [Xylariaceae sp. FL0016]|nr:hypothetical protein F5Y15DRAFT_113251 [Xylariaceae sp. FL0016]
MADPQSPKATPKRKRHDLATEECLSASPTTSHKLNKTIFSFQPPSLPPTRHTNDVVEDGNSSPRTKVAHQLGDLALEGHQSGGGVVAPESGRHRQVNDAPIKFTPNSPEYVFDFDGGRKSATEDMQLDEEDDSTARKRPKFPLAQESDKEPNNGKEFETSTNEAGPVGINESGHPTFHAAVDPVVVKTSKATETGRLQKSYPSINRLADSKSRGRSRSRTPPITSRRKRIPGDWEDAPIVDPIRAALTWHEDEITVYDPDDKDDDGTGINGIGFKPTAAVAYQRAQKRKQQLVEYKKREESEARARRNQRRQDQLGESSRLQRHHSMVRVHFSEAEPTSVMTT